MDAFESKFKLFSIGVAAEALKPGSWQLQVIPKEQMNALDGIMDTSGAAFESSGVDALGQAYNDKMAVGNSFTATWYPIGESNRRTAPCVQAGEQVKIYTYADTGDYYWTCFPVPVQGKPDDPAGPDTRKQELAVYAWGAHDVTGTTQLTDKNSYYMEINTIDKKVTFSTSDALGELATYLLQILGAEGVFKLKDNRDNEFRLDSTIPQFTLVNGTGLSYELNAGNLIINVPENVTEKVGGNVILNIGGNAQVQVGGSTELTSGGPVDVHAPEINLDAATTTVTGQLIVQKGLAVEGNGAINGGLTVAGYANFPGGHGPH